MYSEEETSSSGVGHAEWYQNTGMGYYYIISDPTVLQLAESVHGIQT